MESIKPFNSKREPPNLKKLLTKAEFSSEEVDVKKCQDLRCESCESLLLSKEYTFKNANVWCSGYHYCTTLLSKAWTHVLHRFKSCSHRVGDSRWWGSLTMVPAGSKAKRLLSVNYNTKAIHHHQIKHLH